MKHFRIVLAALALAVSIAAGAAEKKPLKVLAIGNSFSENSVEQNLWDIADADGVQMIIGNAYRGGAFGRF